MAVIAQPDLAAAIKVHLAAESAITALTSTRIYLEWPYASLEVPPYLTAILVAPGRGGPGELPAGRQGERVDILCYGADWRTAGLLWRTVNPYLVPPQGSGRRSSFRAAKTQVNQVTQDSGPIRMGDPDQYGWPMVRGSYIFDFRQEALAS